MSKADAFLKLATILGLGYSSGLPFDPSLGRPGIVKRSSVVRGRVLIPHLTAKQQREIDEWNAAVEQKRLAKKGVKK